jgi:hypothetical protein
MSSQRRFCAVCKGEIPAERIASVPETRLCLKHAEEIKKYGGEFIGTGEQGSLGKANSLKKNYGDVTVTWQRNDEGLERLLDDHDREQWEQKKQQGS